MRNILTTLILMVFVASLSFNASRADEAACRSVGALASVSGGQQVVYVFKNKTNSRLNIYWINYQGNRVLYANPGAGLDFTVNTYVGHPWVVTTIAGDCIDVVLPETSATQKVVTLEAHLPSQNSSSSEETSSVAQDDPGQAARNCMDRGYGTDLNTLAGCWVYQMASGPQKQIANCVMTNGDWTSAAFCMSGRSLSPTGVAVARCAINFVNQPDNLAFCARNYAGSNAEAVRLAGCVGANSSDFIGAALCIGGNRLTPEQQVFAECAYETGLQAYAFAVCATAQLTANEFEKCIEKGVGGRGCFGNNNFFVKAVRDAWHGVSGGRNSILNRPQQLFGGPQSVVNDPAQIWGGKNSVFNNPSQILGGPNSVVRNPAQIWGGPNSVVRKPDQILGGQNSFFHKQLGIHL